MKHKHATDGRASGPRNLYEAMGLAHSGCGKYKTDSEEEYVDGLKVMNMADLQSHAIEMGIKPNGDRTNLIQKLRKEFRVTQSSYKGAVSRSEPKSKDGGDKRKKALDIMKRLNGI